MDLETFKKEFYKNGFVVVENCISLELLDQAKQVFLEGLEEITKKKCGLQEGMAEALRTYRLSDLQIFTHNKLQVQGIRKKLLLQPAVLEKFIHLIGPDLAYNRGGQISVNTKEQGDNLYRKRWHQEMWSGAGLNEVWIWIPLFMQQGLGGMEFIPGSHLWGIIPNRNREPTELPPSAQFVEAKIKEGDAVLFHPLTLHRTLPNPLEMPRVAFGSGVRNFNHRDTGIEPLLSWTPFHYSPYVRIRRALGNPYLTPFRTFGGQLTNADDGKKDLEGLDEFKI